MTPAAKPWWLGACPWNFFSKFDVQICTFWCILTAIKILVLTDDWVYICGKWLPKNFSSVLHTSYRVWQNKVAPLSFVAVFSATVWNFNLKFYGFIFGNILYLTAKWNVILRKQRKTLGGYFILPHSIYTGGPGNKWGLNHPIPPPNPSLPYPCMTHWSIVSCEWFNRL